MFCIKVKKHVGETSVQHLYKLHIKWLSLEDYSNTTGSLCITSVLFRYNGHGEVIEKESERFKQRPRNK